MFRGTPRNILPPHRSLALRTLMRSIKLPFALIMLGLSFAGCASMSVPTATRLLEETGYQIQETTENPSPTAPDGNVDLPDSEPDPATAPVSARRHDLPRSHVAQRLRGHVAIAK